MISCKCLKPFNGVGNLPFERSDGTVVGLGLGLVQLKWGGTFSMMAPLADTQIPNSVHLDGEDYPAMLKCWPFRPQHPGLAWRRLID